MTTANVAGSVPAVGPMVEQPWRATCARSSVVLGVLGLLLVTLLLVVELTFLLSVSGEAGAALFVGGIVAVAGAVTGFLGRRSRRRRSAIIGSLLSWLALLGFGWAAFFVPYEPGISGVAWSPDGTRIVFAHTWSASDGADGIWLVSADGSSEPTHLMSSGYAPDWSPAGPTIAYGASPGEAGDLWLMDAAGSNPRKLSAADRHEGFSAWFDTGHSWSPDATQIVFTGEPLGEGSQGIWIVGADGQGLRQVTAEGFAPDWSPDGEQIAYYTWPESAGRLLWVVDIDGTGRTQLDSGIRPGAPQWTPDGRIAVDCAEGLCVMDANGGNRQVLTGDQGEPPAYESGRILSPDGKRVAYVTGAGIKSDIVVAAIDGSSRITLIH